MVRVLKAAAAIEERSASNIAEGVLVRVGARQEQIAERMPHAHLQCVPVRLHGVYECIERRISLIRSEDVRENGSAVNLRVEVVRCRSRRLIDVDGSGQEARGISRVCGRNKPVSAEFMLDTEAVIVNLGRSYIK